MSYKLILEDWSEYDNKKITGGEDAKDFACTEIWEVSYLIGKIRKNHPEIKRSAILAAIMDCCQLLKAPHPREPFVRCVCTKLGIRILKG